MLKKGVELKMRVEIDEKEVKIIIHKWTPFTTELLKLYSDHFNEIVVHQKVEASQVGKEEKRKRGDYRYWTDKDDKFIIENRNKMPIEKMSAELNRTKSAIQHRIGELRAKNLGEKKSAPDNIDLVAPDNTDLFLKWLESWEKGEFETSDFISAHPQISEENATKIMVYQVQRGNLYQMGKDAFVVKKKEEEE